MNIIAIGSIRRLALIAVASILLPPAFSSGATNNRVTTKEFVVEPPTLISLGFEWYVDGDDNRNASVAVSYRKKGASDWKEGLPFLRLHFEQSLTGSLRYTAPNMFAGSIFDLEPDTEYECRFVLSDPAGVNGAKEKQVTVRTRPEPKPAAGGKVYHVYPTDWKGPKQEPNFIGLYNAYFDNGGRAILGDWYDIFPPRVHPGDTILVHAGLYEDDRYFYGHEHSRKPAEFGVPNFRGEAPGAENLCCGTMWDGTYYLTASGTADKPIVIKGAGDGEVIFDGDGNGTLFNLMAANYTYIEGITFRNTEVAILAGLKNIAGSTGLTVKRCKFDQVGAGVFSAWTGSKNFYIVDNVFIGKQNPAHPADILIPATLRPPYQDLKVVAQSPSRLAIRAYGSGHVIAFNQIRNFHDGIDMSAYGLPDEYPNTPRDKMPVSNDIYNNDLSNIHDDCMESDGTNYNIRFMRNRCLNMAGSGFHLNGQWGGPAYLIQNIVYHANGLLALSDAASGMLFYNNTLLVAARSGPNSNIHFRNNLILSDSPTSPAFELSTFTSYSSSDYNGFMAGAKSKTSFGWRAPAPGAEPDYRGQKGDDYDTTPAVYPGLQENRQFKTLTEFSQATGQDKHSIMVTYDIFQHVQPAEKISLSDQEKVYDPNSLDFTLKPGSPAVDAGVVLPNITDGYTGKAPDLGALESGQPVPHYGPRP